MQELAPNVLSYEKTANRYGELFQSNEAYVGVWSDVGTSILKTSGVPVDFAFPQDGGYLLGGMLAALKNSPNPQGAQELINLMLDPKTQAYIAESQGFGPLNKKTQLKPEVAAKVVNGTDQMSKLQRVDWGYLNTVRPQWTERMAKEIESIQAR
jgi:putative spermidine/putrescine transport system substrate-binding protein